MEATKTKLVDYRVKNGVAWIELLRDPDRRHKMEHAAKALVDSSRGAVDRAIAAISQLLPRQAQ